MLLKISLIRSLATGVHRVLHSKVGERARTDQAGVTLAARRAVREGIVAGVRDAVIQTKCDTCLDDLGLREVDEGSMNLELLPLDTCLRRQIRKVLESLE